MIEFLLNRIDQESALPAKYSWKIRTKKKIIASWRNEALNKTWISQIFGTDPGYIQTTIYLEKAITQLEIPWLDQNNFSQLGLELDRWAARQRARSLPSRSFDQAPASPHDKNDFGMSWPPLPPLAETDRTLSSGRPAELLPHKLPSHSWRFHNPTVISATFRNRLQKPTAQHHLLHSTLFTQSRGPCSGHSRRTTSQACQSMEFGAWSTTNKNRFWSQVWETQPSECRQTFTCKTQTRKFNEMTCFCYIQLINVRSQLHLWFVGTCEVFHPCPTMRFACAGGSTGSEARGPSANQATNRGKWEVRV